MFTAPPTANIPPFSLLVPLTETFERGGSAKRHTNVEDDASVEFFPLGERRTR